MNDFDKERQGHRYRKRIQETKDAEKAIKEYTREHRNVGGLEERGWDIISDNSGTQMPSVQ